MDQFIPEGYSFLKNLTNGFFGPSVLLKNDKNNNQYILKCFSKSAIGDAVDVANFIRIIKTARRIKEKCFLPYYHYYDVENNIYCLRPFFEGLNLTSYISNLDLDQNLVLAQWKVIVRLYRHLHKYKIAPNFIKPNNIFLESGRIAFITDIYPPPRRFNPTIHRTNPFDVGFLAPEFLSDTLCLFGSDDMPLPPESESDVWSLGVLLWFMLMKTLPWNLNNVVVMLKQIQQGTPDSTKEFPFEINEYISSTMQVDPSLRPTTEILIHRKPQSTTPLSQTDQGQPPRERLSAMPREFINSSPVSITLVSKERRSSLRNAAEIVVKGPQPTHYTTSDGQPILTFPVRRRQTHDEPHSATPQKTGSAGNSSMHLTLGQNRLKRRTISTKPVSFPRPQ